MAHRLISVQLLTVLTAAGVDDVQGAVVPAPLQSHQAFVPATNSRPLVSNICMFIYNIQTSNIKHRVSLGIRSCIQIYKPLVQTLTH